MNRRHHIDRPAAPPTRGEDPPRVTCEADMDVIGALIDRPTRVLAARDAAVFCRGCELRATCLTDASDPNWAAAAESIRAVLEGAA